MVQVICLCSCQSIGSSQNIAGLLSFVIYWCNDNAGFVSAIGVIATIIVAVLVAYFPYRTSLAFNYYLEGDASDAESGDSFTCPLHIFLCNSGNTALAMK